MVRHMNSFQLSQLERNDLFRGLKSLDIPGLCKCLGIQVLEYDKDQTVISEGEAVKRFGIVSEGVAKSVETDTVIGEGEYISLLHTGEDSPETIIAIERLTVLFIQFDRLTNQCRKNCINHSKVLHNFIRCVCEKAIQSERRTSYLLIPSVGKRIMTYLKQLDSYNELGEIVVPFDRVNMARYLNIERSSLSRELSRLKRGCFIDFEGNKFKIL